MYFWTYWLSLAQKGTRSEVLGIKTGLKLLQSECSARTNTKKIYSFQCGMKNVPKNVYLLRLKGHCALRLPLIEYLQNIVNRKNFNSLEACKNHWSPFITQKDTTFWEDGCEDAWKCHKINGKKLHICGWINWCTDISILSLKFN